MILTILDKLYRMFRRKYYYKFNPGYIKKSLEKRKGECLQCGCCSVLINPCEHFCGKECNVYGTPSMPIQCKEYPLDEKDKNEHSKKYCGYYWE